MAAAVLAVSVGVREVPRFSVGRRHEARRYQSAWRVVLSNHRCLSTMMLIRLRPRHVQFAGVACMLIVGGEQVLAARYLWRRRLDTPWGPRDKSDSAYVSAAPVASIRRPQQTKNPKNKNLAKSYGVTAKTYPGELKFLASPVFFFFFI